MEEFPARPAFEKSLTPLCILPVFVRFIIDEFPTFLSRSCSRTIPFLMSLNSLLEIGTVSDIPTLVVPIFEEIDVKHYYIVA